MAILGKQERNLIKLLLTSPGGQVLEMVVQNMMDKYKEEFGARESEWETIRNTLINEGKIRGLKELIQELYLQAGKNE